MRAFRLANRALSSSVRGSKLYSWGKNEVGELARDVNKSPSSLPGIVENFPPEGARILSIAAGARHALCATESGDVYAWGGNRNHVLGTSGDEELKTDVPTKVPGLSNVVEVSCGESSSAALTKDGRLFTWGFPGSFAWGSGALGRRENEDATKPHEVMVGGTENIRLKQISSGQQHMLGLGLDGEVWVWGKGASGLMGDGRNLDRALPVPVSFLLDINVVAKQVACGSNFNLVLDEKGQIHAWGGNERGQLGLGGGFSMDLESVPRPVEALANEKIVHVSAGDAHGAAVTENGEVYMWGYSIWTEPHKMTALSGKRVVKTACGRNFTIALTDSGELYSWGKSIMVSRTGALGLGDNGRHAQPELIKAMPESASDVACGQRFVLAVNGLPAI